MPQWISCCSLNHYVIMLHPLGYIHIAVINRRSMKYRSVHRLFREFSWSLTLFRLKHKLLYWSNLHYLETITRHSKCKTVAHPEWHCSLTWTHTLHALCLTAYSSKLWHAHSMLQLQQRLNLENKRHHQNEGFVRR